MRKKTSLAKRFWPKVDICQPDKCWEWRASKHNTGYGQLYMAEKKGRSHKEFSHRVAWMLTNGDIKDGMHVLHRCDNRLCCNPRHLFLGTNEDNIRDMYSKFRHSHGETHTGAKLSECQAKFIRNSLLSNKILSERFSISTTTVRDIKNGRTWKHLCI